MIDIVIVNWNAGKYIHSCIESIHKNSDGLINQIIVVDNNSSDSSDAAIENMSKVRLIKLQKNLGFAKACNIGATYAKSNYLLFLNPDTIIYPGVFVRVYSFMVNEDNAQIAICGVQQINREGEVSRHCCRKPTKCSFIYLTIGFSIIFPKLGHLMQDWNHSDSRQVDHVIGSFYFIRRKIFEGLQGFDERFFVYLEDLDLSIRVKKLGWKIMYLSDVSIKHFCGGSSQQIKSRRLFYSLRSRLLYVEKHYGIFFYLMILFAIFSIELILRLTQSLVRLSFMSCMEILKSYWYLAIWVVRTK